ncbi:hypothetical protein UlMin_006492 [Ulmus minor]
MYSFFPIISNNRLELLYKITTHSAGCPNPRADSTRRMMTRARGAECTVEWVQRDDLFLRPISGPMSRAQSAWIPIYMSHLMEGPTTRIDHLRRNCLQLWIHWLDRFICRPFLNFNTLEIEYDPTRQFCSVTIEEQLDALGKAIVAGKIRYARLSNETPYGVMKFVQAGQRDPSLLKIISMQNSDNLLSRSFDSGMAECYHHERIMLLGYSSLAMFVLSRKYFSPNGGPTGARLNIFRGIYSEGESRYSLSNQIIKAATMIFLICISFP